MSLSKSSASLCLLRSKATAQGDWSHLAVCLWAQASSLTTDSSPEREMRPGKPQGEAGRGQNTVIHLTEHGGFSEVWKISLDSLLSKWYWFSTPFPSLATPQGWKPEVPRERRCYSWPRRAGRAINLSRKPKLVGFPEQPTDLWGPDHSDRYQSLGFLGKAWIYRNIPVILGNTTLSKGSPLIRICLTSWEHHQNSAAWTRPVSKPLVGWPIRGSGLWFTGEGDGRWCGQHRFYIWAALLLKWPSRPSWPWQLWDRAAVLRRRPWTRSGLAMLKVPGSCWSCQLLALFLEFGQVPGIHILRCSKVTERVRELLKYSVPWQRWLVGG